MRARTLAPLLILAAGAACSGGGPPARGPLAATYEVRLLATDPARIAVRATVPAAASLAMATSRPGDVPEVADAGWPALVRNLAVTDAGGRAVEAIAAGAGGWALTGPASGPLTLAYEVDYAPLAARGWPARREAAFADGGRLAVIGRSLFITSPAQGASTVRFELPAGWHAATPWNPRRVAAPEDLTENLLAFTHDEPDVLASGGFRLNVVSFGHWLAARDESRRALGSVVKELVAMTGFGGRADYLVVLLPQAESGGESFRASFALNTDAPPSRANLDGWAHLVAHEVLHYWNGWRLRGADYASSQWFQEGFTEYGANLAMVAAELTTPRQFHARLAGHVANYRKLATPLDAPGTRKGPPLYSGGALVAFAWDGMLREATRGQRGYADLVRELLRRTGDGARPYGWPDIHDALAGLTPGAWAEFHARHIHGTEPLPLEAAFARVGLRLTQDATGAPVVEPDPAAGPGARQRHRELIASMSGR
jgi:predicted metalloprotease with PDZ domain